MIYNIDTITGERSKTAFKTLAGIVRKRKCIIEKVILKTESILIINVGKDGIWCYLDDGNIYLKLKK